MDLASLFGIISGILLIFIAIIIDGDIRIFFNLSGLMVVFGGTAAAALLTFPAKDIVSAFKSAYYVFKEPKTNPNNVVATMVELCNLSRRKGLLEMSRIKTKSEFLRKAAQLMSDGADEGQIRRTLEIEMETMKLRHLQVQDVFKKLGAYAPAFGMLGTLIGLVKMLANLQDPNALGPAMAVAILTTFYGSMMSSLFFLPIAGKLRARTVVEMINLEIMFEGAISIMENNNPYMVYEKLSSYIPRKKRRPMKRKFRASDA